MDEGTDSMSKPEEPTPGDKELAIERARARLDSLVAEIDRRRHELTDVRLQLRKHVWVVVAVAFTAASAIGGTVFWKLRSARRRHSLLGRAGRFREAFGRMLDQPDRVATSEPNVLKKVAAAAATAVAARVARGLVERAVHAVTERPQRGAA